MSQRYLGGVITANPTTPTMTTESGVWTLEQQFQYSSVWSPKIVGNSVRLRSSASAYFNRTPGSSSNRQVWTYSAWVKYSVADNSAFNAPIFWASGAGGATGIAFAQSSNTPHRVYVYNAGSQIETTQVLRDPSAWYHLVAVVDNTQATASNRTKLYINGALVTALTTANYPAQNANGSINEATEHNIGRQVGLSRYFDGYLAEVNFIDGQALTPASFGAFDTTGVWQPLLYTGTYGTNGFYLTFADNSGATATTIGKDYSGNGNNWTPNNISVTAGTTYDWMLDSPTNWTNGTGNGVGNYCTWNPLDVGSSNMAASNANLTFTKSAGNFSPIRGTIAVTTGKYYFEMTANTTALTQIGVSNDYNITQSSGNNSVSSTGGAGAAWDSRGFLYTAGSSASYAYTFTTNDVVMVAFDAATGKIWFGKNGTWNTGSPADGTSPAATASNYNYLTPFANGESGGSGATNFGQRPFAYTPPTGFKALNTLNLPDPTIMNGAQYMAASLYTGNAGSITVTNTVNGTSFQPDLVWVKARSSAYDHKWVDSVRGSSGGIYYDLQSNTATAESLPGAGVNGLNSTGFTIGGGTNNGYNGNGTTFVAWQWQAGKGVNTTNTAGSLTSTTSVSTTAGFSVVTYTGNGSSGATIGHGLGVAPRMIIIKNRASTYNWRVGHSSLPSWSYFMQLDGTNAQTNNNVIFNGVAPTSSVFTVGNDVSVNASGQSHVAYCFAPVTGYSAFGSYTGNGSSDGPFVYLGFRPRWVMSKRTDSTGSWLVVDSARNTYNVVNGYLVPNTSDAEGSATWGDFTSNGFKLRGTTHNGSGESYIYAAFAENPFKIARAR